MLKRLFTMSFILLLVVGVIGQGFVAVPSAHAQNRDSDGDGLTDDVDACPNSPGPRTNNGCPLPDPDRDGDGIPDAVDVCPDVAGAANNGGCPDSSNPPPPDTDGDGTADPQDSCPNQPGDGANNGCPAGITGTPVEPVTSPQQPTIDLIAMPTNGMCVVSTLGTSPVNIREYPLTGAAIVATLQPNEIAEVLAIIHQSTVAETEHGDGVGPLILPPQPNPDPNYPTWVLIQDGNTNAQGWVAEAVIRYGGDCSDFDAPDNDTPYLKLKLSSHLMGDEHEVEFDIAALKWGDNEGFDIELIALATGDGSVPTETFSLNFEQIHVDFNPDGGLRLTFEPTDDMPPTVTPNDDGSTTFEYCVYEQVHEVGVWEEVCYEIEIPEGCVLTTAEAGVYTIECEEDEITVNPALNTMDRLQSPDNDGLDFDVTPQDDGSTTFEYCVYEQVHEVGVWEEVCYEIEIPEGCVLTTAEAGVYTIECEEDNISVNPALGSMDSLQRATSPNPLYDVMPQDDGSTTFEYCVYEQVHEVGVWEEVCYEIEVPEGCVVTSPEAGVYDIECEGDAEITLNPAIAGMPAADILMPGDGSEPLIGLLLPAVQQAR